MARVLARREISRHYDDDLRNLVIVEEVDSIARWNWGDDRKTTTRVERRVPLTAGERRYLQERRGNAAGAA